MEKCMSHMTLSSMVQYNDKHHIICAIKGVVEMAEHLGKQDIADKYRALYEKASVLVDEKLFNGEYYIQDLKT